MKLFFETAGQAQAFLAAVPLGLVLAACLDASVLAGPLRCIVTRLGSTRRVVRWPSKPVVSLS